MILGAPQNSGALGFSLLALWLIRPWEYLWLAKTVTLYKFSDTIQYNGKEASLLDNLPLFPLESKKRTYYTSWPRSLDITELIVNGDHTEKCGRFRAYFKDAKTSVWALTKTLSFATQQPTIELASVAEKDLMRMHFFLISQPKTNLKEAITSSSSSPVSRPLRSIGSICAEIQKVTMFESRHRAYCKVIHSLLWIAKDSTLLNLHLFTLMCLKLPLNGHHIIHFLGILTQYFGATVYY